VVRQTASSSRCRVWGDAEGESDLMGGAGSYEPKLYGDGEAGTAAGSLEDSEGERKPMGVS
jgi:hypothetical protein